MVLTQNYTGNGPRENFNSFGIDCQIYSYPAVRYRHDNSCREDSNCYAAYQFVCPSNSHFPMISRNKLSKTFIMQQSNLGRTKLNGMFWLLHVANTTRADLLVLSHVKPGLVSYITYHGTKRHLASISSCSVVLTTYDTLKADMHKNFKATNGKSSGLHRTVWHRVVLDEGTFSLFHYYECIPQTA